MNAPPRRDPGDVIRQRIRQGVATVALGSLGLGLFALLLLAAGGFLAAALYMLLAQVLNPPAAAAILGVLLLFKALIIAALVLLLARREERAMQAGTTPDLNNLPVEELARAYLAQETGRWLRSNPRALIVAALAAGVGLGLAGLNRRAGRDRPAP